MNELLVKFAVGLNALANAVARVLLAFIGYVPGWMSATIVAVLTGLLMLVAFKYTSNQRAIKQTRNDIKADLLALSLFKDDLRVCFASQRRILVSAWRLLTLALVPMLVMLIPMCLLLSQLALWYQVRPLRVGEAALVTVQLSGADKTDWPTVQLEPNVAVQPVVGPVRVWDRHQVCWNIEAREDGYHPLVFDVNGRSVAKQLAVGDGYMRVSEQRPTRHWSDVLRHPGERPFGVDSPVRQIEIDYPRRSAWTSGSRSWLVYWFVASMVAALGLRRIVNVNI